MQMDEETRTALWEEWELNAGSPLEKVTLALSDLKMTMTERHNLASFQGSLMVDGIVSNAREVWEALTERPEKAERVQ